MSTTLQQNEQNLIAKENVSGQNNLSTSKSRMASGNGVPSNKAPLSLSRNQFANSRGLSNRNSTKRRWRLYPRGLYPIAEATESQKDDELTNDKEKFLPSSPAALSLNHLNIKRDPKTPQKPVKNCNIVSSYNLHGLNILSNTNPYDKNKNNTKAVVSTSNYSACQKLVDDFQRSVTEQAVKVIQSHYRKFKLRREFLRIRDAAKTIQRYVRKWIKGKQQNMDNSQNGAITQQDVNNNALSCTDSLDDCNVHSDDVEIGELAEGSSDTSSGLGVDIDSSFESNCSTSSSGFVSESVQDDQQCIVKYETLDITVQTCTDYIISRDLKKLTIKRDCLNNWLTDLDIAIRQPPPLVEEECCDIWSDDEYLDVLS